MINNVRVYGLDESVIASGYPMATDNIALMIDYIAESNKHNLRALKLAQTEIGTGHDQFLTGIVVQFDLTFTIKAWTEAQRYHFFDFVSSQSTMHCITKFDLDKQYIEYVDKRMIEIMKELVDKYNETKSNEDYLRVIYSNPVGFRLTARMTTNYRQLKTMYKQRKNHKLTEWQEFCKWIESLPYSEFITGK